MLADVRKREQKGLKGEAEEREGTERWVAHPPEISSAGVGGLHIY